MTMSESGDVLERFFEALLHEITASRPEYLTGPFTVAEIYQDIVPYRSHRDLIGVKMSGDYEDALIRLLGGEGNYLLLDSAVAREELQKEVARPNPDTSLFREYAAVDVRLDPGRLPVGTGLEPECLDGSPHRSGYPLHLTEDVSDRWAPNPGPVGTWRRSLRTLRAGAAA